jgi:hypothetical protein
MTGQSTVWCATDGCREHMHFEATMEGRLAPEMAGWSLAREDGEPLRALKRGESAQLVYLCPTHAAEATPYRELLKR